MSTSAFILHHYPYQESSVLLKLFTESEGLVTAIAKGAKRPRSQWYAVLQPFTHLSVTYRGRGEVQSLTSAELITPRFAMPHESSLCGFYLNELLLHLLPKQESLPALFTAYQHVLQQLVQAVNEPVMRAFEWQLLTSVGYGIDLAQDEAGAPLGAEQYYQCLPGELPRICAGQIAGVYSGEVLQAIAQHDWSHPQALSSAKKLLRHWIDFYTQGKLQKKRDLLGKMLVGS